MYEENRVTLLRTNVLQRATGRAVCLSTFSRAENTNRLRFVYWITKNYI